MVLVSDKLNNDIGLLQTKLSYREGHKARRVGLQTMPLDQDIEDSHGEREPGVEIGPDAMHDLLEVRDQREHREHRFHQHALLPLPPLTHFEVTGIALRGMETRIA